MNISSISAPTPVNPPATSTPQTTNAPADGDAGAAQPPVQAALPPGQGTRIDQIA
jgi:hypothetical protein